MSESEWISEVNMTLNELISRLTFPGYWPPGLPDQVLRWLKSGGYDPRTMPKLSLASAPDGTISILGWSSTDADGGPNFIEAVRGYSLTDFEEKVTRTWPNAQWCPRCWNDAYVPYDAEDKEAGYEAGFVPPALSRCTRGPGDARIYVCSDCGQAEAMEEWGGNLTPPEHWPVGRKGFGWATKGGIKIIRKPYGENEGDIWTGTGSEVANRLPAGQVLIHEIINGEDSVYVTEDPEIIERARKGDELR